jgi:hypothetical protein
LRGWRACLRLWPLRLLRGGLLTLWWCGSALSRRLPLLDAAATFGGRPALLRGRSLTLRRGFLLLLPLLALRLLHRALGLAGTLGLRGLLLRASLLRRLALLLLLMALLLRLCRLPLLLLRRLRLLLSLQALLPWLASALRLRAGWPARDAASR